MPSNVQVYIVGVVTSKGWSFCLLLKFCLLLIDVHNSKRLEHMTVNAMKVNRPHVPCVEAVEVYS